METLEELVASRKGYKYLNADGTSPYKGYKYDLKSRRQMSTKLDENPEHTCGEGWSLATIDWINRECLKIEGYIIECEIPNKAKIVVPVRSDGKFRTDLIKIKKVHEIETFFPVFKDIKERMRNYYQMNPITAEEMPPVNEIKKIMAQVGDQIGDQIGDQVWAQIGAQVRSQVRDQAWAQIWDQVRAKAWAQIGAQIWDQVRSQVRAQVRVFAYYAIKLFLDLPYEHPAFDLVRLGIIVVTVDGKVKVFGKGGKFLGEFDE